MSRPLVKICGVTSVADAVVCADLGVDLLGLNFWPGSPRYVEVGQARAIADSVRGRLGLVGVFVNRPGSEIVAIEREVGLDRLQFHGDEPADEVRRFGSRAVRAIRVDPENGFDHGVLTEYAGIWGYLFDVASTHAYGGTGLRWPYERIAGLGLAEPKLVAGGVGPETARQALRLSRADGVDVCSGVESSPGVKDAAAVERLVREVRGG
ncbi:MAG: phosphoribosylanthranilate isomerase [Acidobacteriota bacterium]|nr:phosphoribosylanthranilate isomerase [Acidobacteriota bacterium]MDH3522381.1 phosphoribosylanthranilate isomerase [Acidobacteriota bacterium]